MRTYDGSAAAGSDYGALDATVTFVPGQNVATANLTIANDTIDEPDETVNVILGPEVNGAQLGTTKRAILTIVDDDTPGATPSMSVDSLVGVVEGSAVVFTVSLSGASNTPVTVDYGTTDATATAVVDYTQTPGSSASRPA